MFTFTKEAKFRKKIVEEFEEEIYWMDVEQSHDFVRLNALQTDQARLDKIETFDREIAELKRKQKLNTKVERDRIAMEIERVKFLKSKLTMPEQRVYESITERAQKIKSAEKMLAFVRVFKAGNRDQLPFAVIDGTRFKVVDNIIQKDADGNQIFHVQPAPQNPEPEEPQEEPQIDPMVLTPEEILENDKNNPA